MVVDGRVLDAAAADGEGGGEADEAAAGEVVVAGELVVAGEVVAAGGVGTGRAWAEVRSFKPCSLGLTSLPAAVLELSSLTLLWANDNRLATLPPLPASLTELYLHRNHLPALPAAVIGSLGQLRSLWAHENRLEALPASIGALRGLRSLVAFRNRLGALPPSIGALVALRELRLDENQLTALPASIGELRGLEILDVSNNRLTALPRSIGKLGNLSSLRVWYNRLATFPEEICDLAELTELSASQNELVALPAGFGSLSERLTLNLVDNPLQKPPLAIAERGVGAIRRYFAALAQRETVISRWGKLVLVGDGEVGKTSLLRLLQWRRAAPTAAEERTVQLDMSMLGVKTREGAGQAGREAASRGGKEAAEEDPDAADGNEAAAALFSCWDLSGQPEYAAAQQPFITCGPLFLLAVPAHRCHDDECAPRPAAAPSPARATPRMPRHTRHAARVASRVPPRACHPAHAAPHPPCAARPAPPTPPTPPHRSPWPHSYAAVLGRWLDVLQASAPGAVVQPVVTQVDRLLSAAALEAAVERHELRTTTQCIAGVPSAIATAGRLFYEVGNRQ